MRFKGEAGSLSDIKSNPKRGQVLNNCKLNVNNKRDKKSKTPGLKDQVTKKESIKIDNKSGLNFQTLKKDSIKQRHNKVQGGDAVGDEVGKQKEGDAVGGKSFKIELDNECVCRIKNPNLIVQHANKASNIVCL